MTGDVYVVDSDVMYLWVFRSLLPIESDLSDRFDPIIQYLDVPPSVVLVTPFCSVADIRDSARFWVDKFESEGGHLLASAQAERLEATLNDLFSSAVNVWMADVNACERWLNILDLRPPHESANREHVWMVVCAQYWRDMRNKVTIVAQEPEIYRAYQEIGLLDDVEIMQFADGL
jgi:hypothetical protein